MIDVRMIAADITDSSSADSPEAGGAEIPTRFDKSTLVMRRPPAVVEDFPIDFVELYPFHGGGPTSFSRRVILLRPRKSKAIRLVNDRPGE